MRKKHIITLVVLLVVGFLVYSWYQKRKSTALSWEKPLITKIEVGDLEIPIGATGTIEPASKPREIKSKASGTVLKVFFEPGDMVREGDLLIELDPSDEELVVSNATAEKARTDESLQLEQQAAAQIHKDWLTAMELALASLDATRAELRRVTLEFRQQELYRQEKAGVLAAFPIVAEDAIEPAPLLDPEFELVSDGAKLLVRPCERTVALAEAEALAVSRLVDEGTKVLSNESNGGDLGYTGRVEYQTALMTMWQARANILLQAGRIREALNKSLLVSQARTRVKLAEQGVRMANVALDQANKRLRETKVYSPMNGQVQQVLVQEGQIIASGITTVTGGTTMMTIADLSRLYVEADVDEADIGRVRDLAPSSDGAHLATRPADGAQRDTTAEDVNILQSASNVKVTVDAFPEETFSGAVERIYPHPQVANNVVTYTVRIELEAAAREKLMLGMHANVDFTAWTRKNVLLVDIEAIKIKNEQHGVYVPGEKDGDEPRFMPVKLGLAGPERIEIETGDLKEGQEVYIRLPQKMKEDEGDKD